MALSLAEDYVTVAQAAVLLHVNRSTIRRWIREGMLPAYRIGQRRVALRRDDLTTLITPARGGEKGGDVARMEPLMIRRLTPEEQRRGLDALARIEALQQKILAERGGKPFSPSWKLLNEQRDERSRQLT